MPKKRKSGKANSGDKIMLESAVDEDVGTGMSLSGNDLLDPVDLHEAQEEQDLQRKLSQRVRDAYAQIFAAELLNFHVSILATIFKGETE